MSRYLGPIYKKSRKLQFSLLESNEEFKKQAPAVSTGGVGKKRMKVESEYGKQLKEKQRVRFTYGVNEKQFRRLFKLAMKDKKNVTGYSLLIILESRLDNLVYRSGLARTRKAARQLVVHNHILVDGKKVNIPSLLVNVGQTISVKESSKALVIITDSITATGRVCNYLEVDKKNLSAVYVRNPERAELNSEIKENLIVEYYNRFI